MNTAIYSPKPVPTNRCLEPPTVPGQNNKSILENVDNMPGFLPSSKKLTLPSFLMDLTSESDSSVDILNFPTTSTSKPMSKGGLFIQPRKRPQPQISDKETARPSKRSREIKKILDEFVSLDCLSSEKPEANEMCSPRPSKRHIKLDPPTAPGRQCDKLNLKPLDVVPSFLPSGQKQKLSCCLPNFSSIPGSTDILELPGAGTWSRKTNGNFLKQRRQTYVSFSNDMKTIQSRKKFRGGRKLSTCVPNNRRFCLMRQNSLSQAESLDGRSKEMFSAQTNPAPISSTLLQTLESALLV